MKNNGYDNSCRRDPVPLPDNTFGDSNSMIFQGLSWFPSISVISLSCNYHFWKYSRQSLNCHDDELHSQMMILVHHTQGEGAAWLNASEYFRSSQPSCTDVGIALLRMTVRIKHKLSSVELVSIGRKISSKTILETFRLWICCSLKALVFVYS